MDNMNIENRWVLYSKYFGNELSDSEEKELTLLLDENAEYKIEMEQAHKVWDLSSENELAPFNTDKGWLRMQKRINKQIELKPEPSGKVFMNLFKVAAGFLILFLLAYLVTTIIGKPGLNEITASDNMKNNPIILSDGTKVFLNAGAQLTYPKTFDINERTVKLTGEAFFDVARNETQPFIIKTSKANIRVLGTSFNVLALKKSDSILVAVKTGVVELSPVYGADKLIISKGNTGVYYVNPGKLKLSATDVNMNCFAWKTDSIIFQNSRLVYVTQTLERIFGIPISIENDNIKNCPITGDFKDNLPNILEAIAASQGLKITKTTDGFYLSGAGCSK
jgi:transmembrane sensor